MTTTEDDATATCHVCGEPFARASKLDDVCPGCVATHEQRCREVRAESRSKPTRAKNGEGSQVVRRRRSTEAAYAAIAHRVAPLRLRARRAQ